MLQERRVVIVVVRVGVPAGIIPTTQRQFFVKVAEASAPEPSAPEPSDRV